MVLAVCDLCHPNTQEPECHLFVDQPVPAVLQKTNWVFVQTWKTIYLRREVQGAPWALLEHPYLQAPRISTSPSRLYSAERQYPPVLALRLLGGNNKHK